MPNPWTLDEITLTMELYCRTPFGKMHQGNPDVVRLAAALGRTAGAVAMKLANLASLDPAERARGIRGLSGASAADRAVFERFGRDMELLAAESEAAARRLGGEAMAEWQRANERVEDAGSMAVPPKAAAKPWHDAAKPGHAWEGPTEVAREVMSRRAQGLFRRAVLGSYEEACAVCSLGVPELLNAGHIIPWSEDVSRRADPTNGMAMCALHDRAFDRGLIAVDEGMRVVVSGRVRESGGVDVCEMHRVGLLEIAGREVRLPRRFLPDAVALAWHRGNRFQA